MKKHIPNIISLGNLSFGCLGIIFWKGGHYELAAYCILLASVMDFFDGFVARLLDVQNPIGKDLDSLADMVSFGVLPGLLMFSLMGSEQNLLAYVSLLIPIGSAYRLAKFNNDPEQGNSFKGLPTPSSAFFVVGMVFLHISTFEKSFHEWMFSPYSLAIISVLLPLMMISNIPLLSLKFNSFAFRPNLSRYLLLTFSTILLIIFRLSALPLVILFYVILSILNTAKSKNEIPGES